MTKEEFVQLGSAVQAGLVYDILEAELGQIEAPQAVRAPKYDKKIYRKGGFQWASETDLSGLKWWRDLRAKQAGEGGQYAEKNQKDAEQLTHWVNFRISEPDAPWAGVRGDESVVAGPPRHKPEIVVSQPRGDDIPF